MIMNLDRFLVDLVRDLELTRYKYHGYAYVRTIRNILTGNKDAMIAPNFVGKSYYGIFTYLSLEETKNMLDKLVRDYKLDYEFTSHGKLYRSFNY